MTPTLLSLERSEDATPVGDADRFECFTDLDLARLPAQRAVIDGLLYEDTLATIIGKWASFKSFIALDMAFCVATGTPYHGRDVRFGAVLYFAGEGRHGVARRMMALRMAHNIGDEIPLVFCFAGADVGDPAELALALHAADRRLQANGHSALEIAAVFVDTLAAHMTGNENGNEEMKRYLEGCRYIRRRTGACVVSVHHSGWSEEIRSRGSTTLPAGVDTEIIVERDGNHVSLKNKKQKDGEEHPEFTLEARELGESLVFRPLRPTSASLSDNEWCLVREVPRDTPVTFSAWMTATGLHKSSFDRARNRLVALAYVRRVGDKYMRTEAGTAALGLRSHAGLTEVP